jgi:hypothetical protein
MGGFGSGRCRWQRKKVTLDASLRLDVRYLKRQDMLQSGSYNMSWHRRGTPSGNVSIQIVAGVSMTVSYQCLEKTTEEWQPIEQVVYLAHTACSFGGSRHWFVCPSCSQRMAVVVVDGALVACRHCLRLPYASCNGDRIDRSVSRRDKYKAKLGGDKGLQQRPKGMHHRTWQRLRLQYRNTALQGWQWVDARLDAIRRL